MRWPGRGGRRAGVALLCLWGALGGLAVGCDRERTGDPGRLLVVSQGLSVRWEALPHRISELELTLLPEEDGTLWLHARNAGGSFGVMDSPSARLSYRWIRGVDVQERRASLWVEIPPGSTVEDVGFSAHGTLVLQDAALARSPRLVALLAGYAVETDRYETPPAFATDPVLPYDPAEGYTTQGLGIWVGVPEAVAGEVRVPVQVRNALGLSDRADMNAAIPQATTWVRVDLQILGLREADRVSRGRASYTQSTASYGRNTVHPHADAAAQRVTLQGAPGLPVAFFGLGGFEVWVNDAAHKDPDCAVVQDATNFAGEPVSGPGRYLTELTVRTWGAQYTPDTGVGSVHLDVYVSNRSSYHEVGNLCAAMAGEVVLVQLDGDRATESATGVAEAEFASGEAYAAPLVLQGGAP